MIVNSGPTSLNHLNVLGEKCEPGSGVKCKHCQEWAKWGRSTNATLPNLSPGRTKDVLLRINFGHMSPAHATLVLDALAVIKPDDRDVIALFKHIVSGKFTAEVDQFGLMKIKLIPEETLVKAIDSKLEDAIDWEDDEDRIVYLQRLRELVGPR